MKTLEAGRYTKHRLMKVNRDEIKHDITAIREERKHWRQVGIQHRLMKVNRDEIKHDITAIREERKHWRQVGIQRRLYEGKQR